jgi:hypothetical protein
MFKTEHEFVLPHGFIDDDGEMHREGTMRMATAADEIHPLKDPRVQKNPAYLVVILLSRVVTRLGSLQSINPSVIEGLFVADLAFLQDMYNRINHGVGEAVIDNFNDREGALVASGSQGYAGNGRAPRPR